MKIAIIASYAPSIVNFRGRLIQDMVAGGHQVFALAPDHGPETTARIEQLGAHFKPIYLSRRGMNPLSDLKARNMLRDMLRDLAPDRVFSYTIKPVIYGSMAAKMAGVPEIFSMITGIGYALTGEGRGLKRRLIMSLAKRLYRAGLAHNKCVFFQNPDDLELFRDLDLIHDHKTVITGGSGVDLEHFSPVPPPEGPMTFLCLSRLLKEKGVREFARAAFMIRRDHPEVRFRLVGPFDPGADSISAETVQAWKKSGDIEICDAVDDVRPEIASCSVYVLPSYREGTPRSVLEAASMGRAVITTDAPGCRQTVVPGKTGLLVEVGNTLELAQAMRQFILNPEMAGTMGEQGRELARKKFDVNKVNALIMDEMNLQSC